MIGGGLLAVALLWAAPVASAEEAPGPAFVDELGSQIQPLRSTTRGEIGEARDAGVAIYRERVLVDVYVKGDSDEAERKLRELGMDVAATAAKPLPVVEGLLPLDSIDAAAKLGATNAVMPVLGSGTDVGAQTSEGVGAHNIPAATSSSGASGAGVDVGVISDSINQVGGGVAASQASGDLPRGPRVVVLDDDETTAETIDEGRAMAEIIYDEAPGLNRILFSTGTETGAVGKAASIDSLVANGADVITDDIFYLSEPFFQDGVVSQAVDRAKAAGVPYFASAGNRARQSYESTYRDEGGLHDFDPGGGVDTRSNFTGSTGVVPSGSFIQIALQWDEPWGAAVTDLDLRIVRADTGAELVSGTTNNVAPGTARLPFESARFENDTGGPIEVAVEIMRPPGAVRDPFMKWIEQDNFDGTPVPEFDTQSDTINPDAASARGALAVAAVNAADPGLNTPEPFSSRGPKTRLFDADGNRFTTPMVLNKPELAAADAVSHTVPSAPLQPLFFGTSAAAPSAAGIAVILRSANPNAGVNEIYAVMTDPANAIDCPASPFPDPDCGAGFILANRAVAALDKAPAVPIAVRRPATPNGSEGWYTTDVGVSWVIDPESQAGSSSGCDPRTIATDGTQTLTCTAQSSGGQRSAAVTIRRDARPPAIPAISGIKAKRTYKQGRVPKRSRIKCTSADATSGLASCLITGYSKRSGKHALTATATDNAGLKSVVKAKYTVKKKKKKKKGKAKN